jgi:hypothetical protein
VTLMNERDRVDVYERQRNGGLLTSRQRRRVVHKRGREARSGMVRALRAPSVLQLPMRTLTFVADSGASVDITDYVVASDLTPRQRWRLAKKDSLKVGHSGPNDR